MNEHLAFIWLSSRTAVGSILPHALLKYFGSAEAIYEANEEDLAAAPVEWKGRLEPFLDKDLSWAQRVSEYCEQNGVGITTLSDHFYPQRLRMLYNPPLLFYHIGKFCDLDRMPSVTVVGTREPSAYGERAAKRLCVDLARGGATLVSGLARGIDSLSHRAALWCDTFTVGVLGCGIDRAYPPENRDLIAEVSQKGLVLTEYAPGTAPLGKHFPMRNRILAALSPVTLVVEAATSSGSLITAEHCIRLKRELYSVPGPIFSATGAGSNHLLRLGAKPALRAEDILSVLSTEFGEEIRFAAAPKKAGGRNTSVRASTFRFPGKREKEDLPPSFSQKPPAPPAPAKAKTFEKCSILELSDEERGLLCLLSAEPKSVEQLASSAAIAVHKLLGLLSSLEIKGYAERKSGNRFCLVDDAQ